MITENCKGYTKDADQDAVTALFVEKYGYHPAIVHDANTIWLVGPIKANGNGRKPGDLVQAVESASKPMTSERARQVVIEYWG